ncbi:MAG: SAM-dependent methyltransferase [Tissierellia bacterium]|nr:SAM-dependent methyltransferase [Tissierellia bacterium]
MSTRLDIIVEMVDENKIVCDVGTDHGITAMRVYDEKSPKKVIGTDISKNSLQKLRDKIKDTNYQIDTVVTDGIKDLALYNPEVIIISGMGGFLISEIIDRGLDVAKKADKLILQANNSLSHLRMYLKEKGFLITDEKIAFDEDIYYDVIEAHFTGNKVNEYNHDYEYEYGKIIIERKDQLLRDKLNMIIEKSARIKSQLIGINTDSANTRILEIDNERKDIEEILRCL